MSSPSPIKGSPSRNSYTRVVMENQTKLKSKSGGKRRSFHGRVFPKAALAALMHKSGTERISKGGRRHGTSKDTYAYVDRKMFAMMEKIMADACVIAGATKGGAAPYTIKERHMIKALERYNSALGLASDKARRKM